ncbi:M48 family metallopeptidase [Edwardsiella anguillarum]|uniref:M48 metallopeptidase family protein n=1 Tax=Edwardsiella anguillarum TaxID=1821960 RepID=UPI0024B6E738|nr:M48 family metallopeptidase [Edwardsiella anguillarum]WHP80719.1 M48 family metallopeptidase [Edwardsiella anguillarum]WHQ18219.1 M48 family metallopeptidase [Edwardsiella anguillarum]WHQ21757.1 M48 family metallopeptidase [Edwardsiella anguillarum]WHQ25280.1 M48 family metallopeptidase [Edwardsiella anguillarum]WHQ28805.1 M48 family metallopeptidase [Edwardsiella anguillarum]
MTHLSYLAGYPEPLLAQVRTLLEHRRLGDTLRRHYPERHAITTDRALYDYAQSLKNRYMRNTPPLSRVQYDSRIQVIQQALGLHSAISRVQGNRLKAKAEIRIASLFRQGPEALLRMIVVHELAHLREKNHDKAFYSLCCHMEPDYHQLEFDARLYLTCLDVEGSVY